MANEKRFIFDSVANWKNVTDKTLYNESIVFLTDETNASKGVKICTHGAEFEMSNESDIKKIINNYLAGKSNIVVKTEEVVVDTQTGAKETKLVISETSLDSVAGTYTKDATTGEKTYATTATQLVQAKAVAGALTEPVNVTLAVETDGTATFTQTFKNLNGDTIQLPSSVFKAGDNISFEEVTGEGLKITAKDTKYNAGTGISLAKATDAEGKEIADTFVINHSNTVTANTETKSDVTLSSSTTKFDFDQYSYDAQGHITGKVTNEVTLPNSAFETYAVSAAADGSNVKVNLDKTLGTTTTTDSISLAGGGDITVSVAGEAGAEVITIKDVPYVGKEAIAVSTTANTAGNKEVSLTIVNGEKILSQDENGLKTSLFVKYDSKTNKVFLTNNNDENEYKADSETIISHFDASAFIKDSFLVNAELVGEKPAETEGGQPTKGQYLKFTFNVIDQDDQSLIETKEVYIEASTFFHETEGDSSTFSVVEFNSEKGAYTVKNTLGSVTVDGNNNAVYSTTNGLATTNDIKTAISTLDSSVAASEVAKDKPAGVVNVLTGITETDGKLTAKTEAEVAQVAYVDNKVAGAEGLITLTADNGEYTFAVGKGEDGEPKDGYVTASQMAAVLNDAWAWGTLTAPKQEQGA